MSASLYGGLSGRVAVVTGASGAIGAEVSRALARHKAKVVVSGRKPEALERLVGEIRSEGGEALAVVADVTEPSSLAHLREEAEKTFGIVSLVAAVAGGLGEPVPLLDLSLSRFRESVDLNLTSVFLTLQAFVPGMISQGRGSIVTVSSLAGQRAIASTPGRNVTRASVAYASAKAGLLMLTQQAASEFSVKGIRINAISPGAVMNERLQKVPPKVLEDLAASHALGRIGTPEDVAEATLFLLSDASSWVTGATIDLNGGMHIG
jgi:3-oxoacyl-[acyl-carrier protein] reductase